MNRMFLLIRLKDAPKELIESETEKMLSDLTLEIKSENYSTELSGGMKRKLSIAIAFIGNSTTVILDEPTAGIKNCLKVLGTKL
jgi:ABC-type multidrug transport system ATPase subunit